jgi:hypothetical protein
MARQQLVSAVPAPALIPSYNANGTTPPKLTARALTSAPSSALAAQLIAQDPSLSAQEMEIFSPQVVVADTEASAPAPDDFLSALRIARGDIPPPTPPQTKSVSTVATNPPEQAMAAVATELAVVTKLKAAVAAEMARRPSLLPAVLPPLGLGRAPTLTQVRGASAYQLAQARNAGTRKVEAAVDAL